MNEDNGLTKIKFKTEDEFGNKHEYKSTRTNDSCEEGSFTIFEMKEGFIKFLRACGYHENNISELFTEG